MATINLSILGEEPHTNHSVVLKEVSINFENNMFYLSPKELYEMYPDLEGQRVSGFHAHLDCDKIMIRIEGFKYFSLDAFPHKKPEISSLQVYGATEIFKLSNFVIQRLDIEQSNILLMDSTVNQFNIGFGIKPNTIRCPVQKPIELNKTDIRYSNINSIRVFVSHESLNIQRATIKRILMESHVRLIEFFNLWAYSTIERLILTGNVKKLLIHNSSINEFEFSEDCVVDELDVKDFYINRSHKCGPHTIRKKTLDTWKLVVDSAKINNDSSTLASAGFEYLKLERRTKLKGFQKAFAGLMEITSGYGYKPIRTAIATFVIIFAVGVLYWLLILSGIDGITLPPNSNPYSIDTLANCIYFSIDHFTTSGSSQLEPIGFIAKFLSGLEAILGVLSLSLFIFSLTKRYGNLD
jgi:hypothetical protein